jgi:hypothetical protein
MTKYLQIHGSNYLATTRKSSRYQQEFEEGSSKARSRLQQALHAAQLRVPLPPHLDAAVVRTADEQAGAPMHGAHAVDHCRVLALPLDLVASAGGVAPCELWNTAAHQPMRASQPLYPLCDSAECVCLCVRESECV